MSQTAGVGTASRPAGKDLELLLSDIFKYYASTVEMVAMREAAQGVDLEYAYQVCLFDPMLRSEFITTLQNLEEIREVSFIMQRETVEI